MRHILITGASSGIGKAIAMACAGEGMAVSAIGLEPAEDIAEPLCGQLRAKGAGYAHYLQADLSDGAKARLVVQRASDAYKRASDEGGGAVDVLVNNAGIQHVAPIEDFPADAWDRVMAVNLSAAFHMMAACLPMMRAQNYGRIVNIASVHGLVASAQKSAYVAAKHGLIGLTKTAALETAEADICCNAICPGWVRTPLVEAQIEARAAASGRGVEEEARLLVGEKQPSAQFVTPDEIGEMVLFLISQKAGKITGSHFVMDGGWTAQ